MTHRSAYLDRYTPPKNGGRFGRNYDLNFQFTTRWFHRSHRLVSDYFSKLSNEISSGICAPREPQRCLPSAEIVAAFRHCEALSSYLAAFPTSRLAFVSVFVGRCVRRPPKLTSASVLSPRVAQVTWGSRAADGQHSTASRHAQERHHTDLPIHSEHSKRGEADRSARDMPRSSVWIERVASLREHLDCTLTGSREPRRERA